MSRGMYQGPTQFHLAQTQQEGALTALQAESATFLWSTDIQGAQTLPDALRQLCWEPILNADGDITDLELTREWYDNDDTIFIAIGPYVTAGSFIVHEANGGFYRYFFDGRQCHCQDDGQLVFPALPLYPEKGGPDESVNP